MNDRVSRTIKRYRRRQRFLWSLHALLVAIPAILTLLTAVLVLTALRTPLPQPVLALTNLAALAAGLAIAWLVAVRPLVRRLTIAQMAARLEAACPTLAGRLTTALHFQQHPAEVERFGYSPQLLDRTGQVLDELRRIPLAELALALPARPFVMRSLAWTGALLAACGLLLAGRGALIMPRLQQLYTPVFHTHSAGSLTAPALIQKTRGALARFTLITPAEEVPHDSIAVVVPPNAALDQVSLMVQQTGEAWCAVTPDPAGQFTVDPISGQIQFCFLHPRCRPAVGSIRPLDPPVLTALSAIVVPHPYTGLPIYELRDLRDIHAPVGADIKLSATASIGLIAAHWVAPPTGPAEAELKALELPGSQPHVQGRLLEAGLRAAHTGSIALKLQDIFDQYSNPVEVLNLRTIEDGAPAADILAPADGALLPEDLMIPVGFQLRDDYGLKNAVLKCSVNSSEIVSASLPLSVTEDLEITRPDQQQLQSPASLAGCRVVARGQTWLDLNSLDLWPGDTVSLWIEVRDKNPLTGPATGRSSIVQLRFPGFDEVAQTLTVETNARQEAYQEALERQREIARQVQSLHEEVSHPGDAPQPSEQFQRLQDLLQDQQDVAADLSQSAREMNESLEEIIQQGQASVRIMQKVERVQQLMDELLNDDMQRLVQQLQEMLSELADVETPGLEAQQTEELAASMDDFERNLDLNIQQLEESLFEMQAEQLRGELERLVQEQQELQAQTEAHADDERPDQQLRQQQQDINQDAQALLERMEQLVQEPPEKWQEASAAVQQALDHTRQEGTLDQLEQALQQMEAGKPQAAAQHQQQAGKSLEKLAQQMEQSGFGQPGTSAEQDIQALSNLLARGLVLSSTATTLSTRLDLLSTETRWPTTTLQREVAGQLRLLADESRRMYDLYVALARGNPFVDQIGEHAFRMGHNNWIEALQGIQDAPLLQSVEWTRQGLIQLNRGLISLLDSLQSTQSMAGESGSLQSWFDTLRQAIQEQRSINQRTRQLRQNRQPGENILQQLQSLARQQRENQQRMRQLAENYQQYRQLLGDMSALEQQMENAAGQLEQGRLNEQLEGTQQEILTRLLDSQKSLREQKFSRQRESTPGSGMPWERTDAPPPLDLDQLRNEILPRLLENEFSPLPEKYRGRVRAYFEHLLSDQPDF